MSVFSRIRNLFRDGGHNGEIADELTFHIEMRTEENMRRGMPAAEARREAERRFGNRTLIAERTREFDIPRWLDRLRQDLRYSVRALKSGRGATVVLIASLAIGIGANTSMFTLFNALLLRPLPVRDPGSLVSVKLGNFCSCGMVYGDGFMNYALWRELGKRRDLFSELFAYAPNTLDFSKPGGEIRNISVAYTSAGMWDSLGLHPVIGRFAERGAPAVAVLGEAFWESEYGRDPGVIGRTITVAGRPLTIIGVAPRRFFGLYVGNHVDLYMPLEAAALIEADNPLRDARYWWLIAAGRLRPGVSAEAARKQLAAMSAAAMQGTIPADFWKDRTAAYLSQRFEMNPAARGFSDVRQEFVSPLELVSGLVALLLLLACANIATLQLSRGLGRQREFAVRVALGASRARLGCQVFVENLIAALAGAALGVALSYPATRVFLSLYSSTAVRLRFDLRPDARVLAFTGLLAVVTAMLFGIAPAVQAMRTAPYGMLKSVRAAGPWQPVCRWLLAVEAGLAVILAAGALLFSGTLYNLTAQDFGFRTNKVLLMQVDTQHAGIDAPAREALYRTMLHDMSALPEAESAAASFVPPLGGRAWQMDLTVESGGTTHAGHAYIHFVTPGFFHAYGTPVMEGRPFSARDRMGSAQVALVNRAFVRSLLGSGPFYGRRIRWDMHGAMDMGKIDAEIIGVVADAKYRNLRKPAPPTVYLPMDQAPPMESIAVALRTRGPAADAMPAVRRTMSGIGGKVTYLLRTFDSQVAASLINERAMAAVSDLFGIIAVLLAGVGIYGLAAYTVVERRAEIGIRMAVGATAMRILRMLFSQTGRAIAAGAFAGALCALWCARFTEPMLYQVTTHSVWVHAGAICALLAAAALAIAGPALRAVRVDPVETLRME